MLWDLPRALQRHDASSASPNPVEVACVATPPPQRPGGHHNTTNHAAASPRPRHCWRAISTGWRQRRHEWLLPFDYRKRCSVENVEALPTPYIDHHQPITALKRQERARSTSTTFESDPRTLQTTVVAPLPATTEEGRPSTVHGGEALVSSPLFRLHGYIGMIGTGAM